MRTVRIGAAARKAGLVAIGAAVAAGLAVGVAKAAYATQEHTGTAGASRMYGDPAAAAPYWGRQSMDDCALMAAADVIGQLTGRLVSEQEIVAAAQGLPSQAHAGTVYLLPANLSDPIRTGHGTDPHDIPVLLAHYGINAVLTSQDDADTTGLATGMEALERYLAGGHKAIVGLNAELIWGWPVQTRDDNGNPTVDHAVVVTGVDTVNGKVHLNDSGSGVGKDETVPVEVFAQSWATSGDRLIVTP